MRWVISRMWSGSVEVIARQGRDAMGRIGWEGGNTRGPEWWERDSSEGHLQYESRSLVLPSNATAVLANGSTFPSSAGVRGPVRAPPVRPTPAASAADAAPADEEDAAGGALHSSQTPTEPRRRRAPVRDPQREQRRRPAVVLLLPVALLALLRVLLLWNDLRLCPPRLRCWLCSWTPALCCITPALLPLPRPPPPSLPPPAEAPSRG